MASTSSSVPGAAERIDVRVSAAVRTDSGVSFGTLRWVAGEQVLIEVDTDMHLGASVEIRVDLSPTPGTALVRCTVMRQLATAPGESSRYVLRNVDMPAEDRSRWLAWLRALRHGGTLSDFGMLSTGSEPIAGAQAQARASEVRAALDGMNARRMGQGSASNPVSGARSDPFGNRSDVKEAGAGRAAMREALRKALSAQVPGGARPAASSAPASTPSTAPTSTPPVSVQPASRGPTPPVAPPRVSPLSTPPRTGGPSVAPTSAPYAPAPTKPAPTLTTSREVTSSDPTFSVSAASGATYLEVKWISGDQFGYDVHSQLTRGILHLPASTGRLPERGDVTLLLRHGGLFLQCRAYVVESGSFGVTLRVSLSTGDIETLRHAARPTSTTSSIRSTPPKR